MKKKMDKFNKLLESFQQNNKLALTISAFGLILFILLSTTLPFKDKIFSALYKLTPLFAAQNIEAGSLKLTATFNSIGVELPFYGDDNSNTTATLEFKKSTDSEWRKGLDLWRTTGTAGLVAQGPSQGEVASVATSSAQVATPSAIPAATLQPSPTASATPISAPISAPTPTPATLTGAFYGSALLLEQNTSYDIKVTINDPDGITGSNVVTGTISTRADNIPPASSLTPTHFVRTDGNDSNPGTSDSPSGAWKTLFKARSAAPSGAVVEIGPGFYRSFVYPEGIARETPLTLKVKYPAVDDSGNIINEGLHSVIEGREVAEKGSGKWTQVTLVGPGNNGAPVGVSYKVWKWIGSGVTDPVYMGITPDRNKPPQRVAHWRLGATYTPEQWTELLYTNKTYNYGFWAPAGSQDIYIRIYDPSNPNHKHPNNTGLDPNNFWVSIAPYGTGTGVPGGRITGFDVRQAGVGGRSGSIIDHNLISVAQWGMRLGSVQDMVIEKNVIVDSNLWTDDPSSKVTLPWFFIKNGVIRADNSRLGGKIGGHSETSAVFAREPNVARFVIRHNIIDGTFDGIAANGANTVGKDFDIHDNLIKHISDDALEPDGKNANWRVWNNRVENAYVGVSPGPLSYGPLYLFRNQFYKIGIVIGPEGVPEGLMFKYAGDNIPAAILYVLHNTIWTDNPNVIGGQMAAGGSGGPANFYLRNNIFRLTRSVFGLEKDVVWNEDYNHFAATGGFGYKGTNVSTDVEKYRTISGQGAHTNTSGDFLTLSVVDNALNNPANGDLTLKTGSPFIDQGVAVPNISDRAGVDFQGSAPDIGVCEGGSCLVAIVPTPTPQPSPTAPGGTATPTPIPTPDPTACTISSTSWSAPSNPVEEGTLVTLQVQTSGGCSGKSISFEVLEDDGLLGTEPVGTNPANAPISGSIASSSWEAEYQPDCPLPIVNTPACGLPEYFFKAKIVGEAKSVSSFDPKLEVKKPAFDIRNVKEEVRETEAKISWETSVASSTKVEYDLDDEGDHKFETLETDTSGVLNHSVTLSSLLPCSEYRYRIESRLGPQVVGSKTLQFQTQGCSGGSRILGEVTKYIRSLLGGEVDLLDSSSKGLKLDIPNLFFRTDAYFQIRKLEKDKVTGAHPPPSGSQAVGESIYHIDAFLDPSNKIQIFDTNVSVTVDYNQSGVDAAGVNETSLRIYRFNETTNKWESLSNCNINTQAKTVTCQTNKFSDFALLGETSNTNSRIFVLGVITGVLAMLGLRLVYKKRRS